MKAVLMNVVQKLDEGFNLMSTANLLEKALKSEYLLYARMQRQSNRKWKQIVSSGVPQLTE
jgi:hypothetical protein